MLVVESVVPGGPADGVLEPGDVLVRLQGQVHTSSAPPEIFQPCLLTSVGSEYCRKEVLIFEAPCSTSQMIQNVSVCVATWRENNAPSSYALGKVASYLKER